MRLALLAAGGLLSLCAPTPAPTTTPSPSPAPEPSPELAAYAAKNEARNASLTAAQKRCNAGDYSGCAELMRDAQLFGEAKHRLETEGPGFAVVYTLLVNACTGSHQPSCDVVAERDAAVAAFQNANWINESEAATLEIGWTREAVEEHVGEACQLLATVPRTLEGKTVQEDYVQCGNPDRSGLSLVFKDGTLAKVDRIGVLPP